MLSVTTKTKKVPLCCIVQDLTLPLISLFTGRGFDAVIQETFEIGPQRIEDLWLRQVTIPNPHLAHIAAEHDSQAAHCPLKYLDVDSIGPYRVLLFRC